jgi:hypothetical protein
MKFLLQKESVQIDDIDVFNLWQILLRHPYQYEWTFAKWKDVLDHKNDYSNMIPVGSLNFVTSWLERYHGIDCLNPIEVPEILRKEKYLKRKYAIIEKNSLPDSGFYFLKHVSRLKSFSFTGDVKDASVNSRGEFCELPDGLYQLSEAVEIASEYRVIVLEDEIMAIQHYDGDPTIFPAVELINEMILQLMNDKERPLAYTMDVAVINGRGTAILEMHPAVSFGTYGYSGSDLPYIYKLGLDYCIRINKPIMASKE